MSCTRFIRSAELTRNVGSVVRDITKSGETCYITEDGRAKAVLLDINRYNALMDLVEDSEFPKSEELKEVRRENVSVRQILNRTATRIRRKH